MDDWYSGIWYLTMNDVVWMLLLFLRMNGFDAVCGKVLAGKIEEVAWLWFVTAAKKGRSEGRIYSGKRCSTIRSI